MKLRPTCRQFGGGTDQHVSRTHGQTAPNQRTYPDPIRGGCFEVIADGELIYSKKATGQHTTNEAMIAAFQERFDLV